MAEAFSDIDCTITIRDKYTKTDKIITADIYSYTESGIDRKVDFKEVIGGMLVPEISNPKSNTISFKYISQDASFEKMMGHEVDISDISKARWDWSNDDIKKDLYRIELKFSDGTNVFYKVYYDARIILLNNSVDNEILEGDIKFIIPLKNINGYVTYMVYDSEINMHDYDAIMGYI